MKNETNKYIALKNKHEKIINNFSQFFAFSDEQLKEGLTKLNTTKENICSTGYGGFIRKSDKEAYLKMWEQIHKESKEALKDEEYLYNGFRYELANHEFCITYDYEETLNCFNLKYDDLTKKQKQILSKAEKDYLNNMERE